MTHILMINVKFTGNRIEIAKIPKIKCKVKRKRYYGLLLTV